MDNAILAKRIAVARGLQPADLVLKNGNVVNVFTEEILRADVAIVDGVIAGIGQYSAPREVDCTGKTICPGFIDAHVHIESSQAVPAEFARAVLPSGTTTVIADPHEMVNVSGSVALQWLLDATEHLPLNVYVMLPSCVPCSPFETSGASLTAEEMRPFWQHPRVLGLGEMMNYPGVLHGADDVLAKLADAQPYAIDGHAPGLAGTELQAYASTGIRTDHECTFWADAEEKLRAGFAVLVREGSASKDLSTLIRGWQGSHLPADRLLFCTDDKHLGDIALEGHIRWNVRQAISLGVAPITALKMASYNTAVAYGLRGLGAVAAGYRADLVVLDDLKQVTVAAVYKDGVLCEDALANTQSVTPPQAMLNSVHCRTFTEQDLALRVGEESHIIELVQYQILTEHLVARLPRRDGYFVPNAMFSKLCVAERHGKNGNLAVCAMKGYGIQNGAIATSVAHDSHNVIAAGDNDTDLVVAMNFLREIGGGYVLASGGKVVDYVQLRVSGLLSDAPRHEMVETVERVLQKAKNMGIPYHVDPFITLSFVALPVIPELRLTDLGLFDVTTFSLIEETI